MDFREIGNKTRTDKTTHHRYDLYYPLYLEGFRQESFNMLEIGVYHYQSMNLWKEYFPNAYIYGLDINSEGEDERSKVYKLDQSKPQDLQFIIDNTPKCKFIIDDGSHHPYHQYLTFTTLFESLLEEGGVYIIEDVECNYWNPTSSIYGYTIGHFNFMELLKSYPDKVNQEFSGVKNILGLSTITFAPNCVIIKKQTKEEQNIASRDYRFKSAL